MPSTKKKGKVIANVVEHRLSFEHLPAFAKFISDKYPEDFTAELLKNSRDENIPVLKHLSHLTEAELLALVNKSNNEFLHFLAENKATEYIVRSLAEFPITNYFH